MGNLPTPTDRSFGTAGDASVGTGIHRHVTCAGGRASAAACGRAMAPDKVMQHAAMCARKHESSKGMSPNMSHAWQLICRIMGVQPAG